VTGGEFGHIEHRAINDDVGGLFGVGSFDLISGEALHG